MTELRVAIATKHEKDALLAPLFAEKLGWSLVLALVDTDALGTFTGDVPRRLSPRETVIEKAKLGALTLGLNFGVASEGSIGAHPGFPFATVDHELMAFVDLEHDVAIVESHVSPAIVAGKLEWTGGELTNEQLGVFDLPNHAVIARLESAANAVKGIRTRSELEIALSHLATAAPKPTRADATGEESTAPEPTAAKRVTEVHQRIWIESDFRAMRSPSRQRNILACAERLVDRLNQACPACNSRGFGRTGTISGAICQSCGLTNESRAKAELWSCAYCSHRYESPRGDGTIGPEFCEFCNP